MYSLSLSLVYPSPACLHTTPIPRIFLAELSSCLKKKKGGGALWVCSTQHEVTLPPIGYVYSKGGALWTRSHYLKAGVTPTLASGRLPNNVAVRRTIYSVQWGVWQQIESFTRKIHPLKGWLVRASSTFAQDIVTDFVKIFSHFLLIKLLRKANSMT